MSASNLKLTESSADEIIMAEDIVEQDSSVASKQLIKEVANWKLEAKSEDNDRYFFHVREVSRIENGEKCYVIGRKGSGKTAISEYLGRLSNSTTFSEKLTFKNFPFNELYSLKNDGYTRPNQYITLWKYLIYSSICRLMAVNTAIDAKLKSELNEIYGTDTSALSRRVLKWVAKEFNVSIFGLSVSISRGNENINNYDSWINRVNILEDVVLSSIDSSRYFIIFDELDEDYRNVIENSKYSQYTALIGSLFKAVQDIKSVFRDRSKYNIFPIIFLRDDIYEIILDADKNKWNDFKIELNWDKDKIKNLVAFRLTRALNPKATKVLPFNEAWERLLGRDLVGMGTGQKKRISSFDFISRSTYLRPRDFVKYLQACAEEVVDGDKVITSMVIKKVDKAFSNYLKEELIDELFAILPDIAIIFDVISQLRKWNFSIREFELSYNEQLKRGNLSNQDVGFVLQVLFLFSVIGNNPKTGLYFFRFTNRDARLNFNERIVVHRGLFKALQII